MNVPQSFKTMATTYPTTHITIQKAWILTHEQDAGETQKLCATQKFLKQTKFIKHNFILKQFIFRLYASCNCNRCYTITVHLICHIYLHPAHTHFKVHRQADISQPEHQYSQLQILQKTPQNELFYTW
jgi:hypothetical protein